MSENLPENQWAAKRQLRIGMITLAALVLYAMAAVGALLVGLLQAFSSFWASAFKEVIVFTLILPVLLGRSLAAGHADEEHA